MSRERGDKAGQAQAGPEESCGDPFADHWKSSPDSDHLSVGELHYRLERFSARGHQPVEAVAPEKHTLEDVPDPERQGVRSHTLTDCRDEKHRRGETDEPPERVSKPQRNSVCERIHACRGKEWCEPQHRLRNPLNGAKHRRVERARRWNGRRRKEPDYLVAGDVPFGHHRENEQPENEQRDGDHQQEPPGEHFCERMLRAIHRERPEEAWSESLLALPQHNGENEARKCWDHRQLGSEFNASTTAQEIGEREQRYYACEKSNTDCRQ